MPSVMAGLAARMIFRSAITCCLGTSSSDARNSSTLAGVGTLCFFRFLVADFEFILPRGLFSGRTRLERPPSFASAPGRSYCVPWQRRNFQLTLPIRVDLPESCFHPDQQS